MYYDLLRSLAADQSTAHEQGDVSVPPAPLETEDAAAVVQPLATAEPPIRITNDSFLDAEPSIVAVNVNGVPWTATAAIKYVDVSGYSSKIARNHFATTSDFVNFTRGELPMAAGYSRSADPLMSANLYTGGFAPKRMYVVGLLHNQSTNDYSAIAVWRSDDGGQNWSQPTLAEIRPGGGYMLDKPAIGVSWHSATLGYIYIAYVARDVNTGNNALVVERSLDGGLSFGNPFLVAYGPGITAPQIVVNSSTGAVHLLWADESNRDIRMATSYDYGISFGAHEVVTNVFHYGTITPEIKAGTYPAARFHWLSGRIIVAWHGDHASNGSTEVYYTYKPCSANCTPSDQDLWTWSYPYGERAVPAFVLIPPGNNSEVNVSRISY